jgi:aerobic-type carbon monoxide dehydrogenase small subunit (CoxS/CutS family)
MPICSSPGTFSITNAFGMVAATTATDSRYSCGFCNAGFLVTATELLESGEPPSEDQ